MPSDDISRLYDFVANTLIQSSQVDDEFNQLVDTCNGKAGRDADNTFTGANTFEGPVSISSLGDLALTGDLTVNGDATFVKGINVSASVIPDTIPDGSLLYDEANSVWIAATGGLETSFAPGLFPNFFKGSACPVYVSASTFTLAYLSSRDTVLGSSNIVKTGSTTVDISTNGTNGCAQSADLAGTIGTSGSSTTITGSSTSFTTDFIVGDVIWTSSGARRITAIGSNTSLTVESAISITSGTSYRRGGEAPNTSYNAYEFVDAFDTGVTGILLDTRNFSGGEANLNFPTYLYRQLPFAVLNDSSSNIIPFYVINWGASPTILFQTPIYALNSGAASTWTAQSLSAQMPKISRMAYLRLEYEYINNTSSSAHDYAEVRPTGSSQTTGMLRCLLRAASAGQLNSDSNTGFCATNASQSIDYQRAAAGGGAPTVNIAVLGFVVTEVP